MKILQVIPYFCFGGAETMCENLTYALKKLGHQVTVVSLYAERTPISLRMEQAGIKLLYLDKKLGLDLSMVPKLMKIMKQEKPDVVHTHLDVIKYAVAAAKLAGVSRCVHTVHNVADKEAEGRLQKYINKTYFTLGWSVPVALSPLVQQTICDFYGRKAEQVPVIYNGVDLSRCIPKESYETEAMTLVHVGRFNEQKNHAGLLQAFQKVCLRYPDCCLHLLGDGELREEMENLARELGISEQVHFLGSQSDVHPYLHEADIFLLPSKYEGMPMTILEAMGTGLPIVASAVGGVPDMLTDRQSGILTTCDPEQVSRAVLELMEQEDLRARLGRKARNESVRFSAGFMAEEYCKVYMG
ncbi:MAG: glycosyltransferase [Oscillospiraceae bacterium]|nr:glycosyltransferase [Oscillospiraceae bacterium]